MPRGCGRFRGEQAKSCENSACCSYPLHEDVARVTVADISRLFLADKEDVEGMQRAMTAEALPGWKQTFQKRIGKLGG